jgi:hypothetical protein
MPSPSIRRDMTSSSSPSGPADPSAPSRTAAPAPRIGRARLKLFGILLVCAAPVIASYLAYYVLPPSGRTNFGDLIEPQRAVPELSLATPDGKPYRFSSLLGQWVLLHADAGACGPSCTDKLFALRQQRTMTGKERDRIDRVWFVTDATTPSADLDREYEGTIVLRADPAELAPLLPVEPGKRIEDYLYVIDPVGNLMMRFPADGEPAKIRKDIGRLLKASRVG